MRDQALLKEIDVTIDRLIENAEAIETIKESKERFTQELDLLEITQESLLAHLIHLDQKLEKPHGAKTVSVKEVKDFSLDLLDTLNCTAVLGKEKIKLRKSRKTSNKREASV